MESAAAAAIVPQCTVLGGRDDDLDGGDFESGGEGGAGRRPAATGADLGVDFVRGEEEEASGRPAAELANLVANFGNDQEEEARDRLAAEHAGLFNFGHGEEEARWHPDAERADLLENGSSEEGEAKGAIVTSSSSSFPKRPLLIQIDEKLAVQGCKLPEGSPRSVLSSAPSDASTAAGLRFHSVGGRRRWSFDSEDDRPDTPFGCTTVMIRNLPSGFTRRELEAIFDGEGFHAFYDFIYLPADISTGMAFEYCFVNLTSCNAAARFHSHFHGFSNWPGGHSSHAAVHWSEALQGLDQLIERYRNSPLMHASVPEELRPSIYVDGEQVAFPPPTGRIRMPRVRDPARKRKDGERRLQRVAEQQAC